MNIGMCQKLGCLHQAVLKQFVWFAGLLYMYRRKSLAKARC